MNNFKLKSNVYRDRKIPPLFGSGFRGLHKTGVVIIKWTNILEKNERGLRYEKNIYKGV